MQLNKKVQEALAAKGLVLFQYHLLSKYFTQILPKISFFIKNVLSFP